MSMLCISDCLRYKNVVSKLFKIAQRIVIPAVWSLSKARPKRIVDIELLMLLRVYLTCFGFISCFQVNVLIGKVWVRR